jgi:hypothetical protein
VCIIADDTANFHRFGPASQYAEFAAAMKQGVVCGNQNDLGIEEPCRQITWATFICEGWKPNLRRFRGGLSNELVIGAKIQYRLSEFMEQRSANEKPDQSFPAAGIQLDDEVVFGPALHPKF